MAQQQSTESTVLVGGLIVTVVGLAQFIRTLLNAIYDRRNSLQQENDRMKAEITELRLKLQSEVTIKEKYYEIARLKHAEVAKWRERYIGAATARKVLSRNKTVP